MQGYNGFLTITQILSYQTNENEFILSSNARYYGFWVELSQINDEKEQVIAYYNKTVAKDQHIIVLQDRDYLLALKILKFPPLPLWRILF